MIEEPGTTVGFALDSPDTHELAWSAGVVIGMHSTKKRFGDFGDRDWALCIHHWCRNCRGSQQPKALSSRNRGRSAPYIIGALLPSSLVLN
jgi:hypothetical protein